MKRIIATTAMALMLGTAAMADNHSAMIVTYKVEKSGDIYASDFIGMRVYANETEWDAWDENHSVKAGAEREWDDIGEVNDVILGRDGTVKAVILGIGGFVGIGEKDVAVPMNQLKLVNEQDDAGDFFLVIKANKDSLTKAEAFKTEERAETVAAIAEAKEEHKMATEGVARPMLTRPAVERDGYRVAEPAELTADTLKGARVYGSTDEDIGEIDRLILNDQGKITKVVIDVGGFIGIGEHPVGVTFDELTILRTEDGSDVRVYIDSNQEALERQPAYKS